MNGDISFWNKEERLLQKLMIAKQQKYINNDIQKSSTYPQGQF